MKQLGLLLLFLVLFVQSMLAQAERHRDEVMRLRDKNELRVWAWLAATQPRTP